MRYAKLLGWAVALLVGYLVITQPASAADLTHQALSALQHIGESFSAFVTDV